MISNACLNGIHELTEAALTGLTFIRINLCSVLPEGVEDVVKSAVILRLISLSLCLAKSDLLNQIEGSNCMAYQASLNLSCTHGVEGVVLGGLTEALALGEGCGILWVLRRDQDCVCAKKCMVRSFEDEGNCTYEGSSE